MNALQHARLLCASCAIVLTSSAALAQGAAAAAEALFQQGRAEMEAGNYASACDKFRESDRLDPAPGAKFNLADCEEKRGNVATAWELFKAVEGQLDPADQRYPIAKQRREALEPRVSRVKLVLAEGAPETTTVRIGALELRQASFGVLVPLDPGEHELIVTALDHTERRLRVTLAEGQTSEVEVVPGEAIKPREPEAPKATTPVEVTSRSAVAATPARVPVPAGRRTEIVDSPPLLGYVLGGIGAVGLATGTLTGILALGKASTADEHCHSEVPIPYCDREGGDANSSGKTLAAVSTTSFAVGIVGVGLGTYFILSVGADDGTETVLVTRGGPTGGTLSLVRRW